MIKGAISVAKKLGVSELFTGLVIVGFGTSFPELMVSVGAAMKGTSDIATGNVIGSNIGNTLLILGICAAVVPLVVTERSLRRDAVAVLLATFLFMFLSIDGILGITDAVILLAMLAAYLLVAYKSESENFKNSGQNFTTLKPKNQFSSFLRPLLLTLSGLVLLIVGARFLLNSTSAKS